MNAVERLAAAIEKLEADRRDLTSVSRWHATPNDLTYVDDAVLVPNGAQALVIDVKMIVTLHRTIDAQLAILRREYKECSISFAGLYGTPDAEVVDLADAILGGS